jgi:hypothetical protein
MTVAAQSLPLPAGSFSEIPRSHWDGELAADIFAPCGTPWLAVFDGWAQPMNVSLGGYALMLTARDGTQAYYAHGAPDRAVGNVRAGNTIGYVSDSGNARGRGCHLHFAVGQINDAGGGTLNPADWLGNVPPSLGPGPGPRPADISPLLVLLVAAVIVWEVV